jgi:hypothetical protein
VAVKLRLTVHHVRLGAQEYRVLQPRPTPCHATLRDGRTCFILRLDRETAWQFAAIWELATRSPRSIVYLPMRRNQLSDDDSDWQAELRPLDLVVVHHSLRLRPSTWPQIRNHLGAGHSHTADIPKRVLRARDQQPWNPRFAYRENLDRFVHHVYAETLFLTGSTPVFGATVGEFTHVADHPDTHPEWRAYCAEFDIVAKPRWPVDVTELFIGHTEAWSGTSSP